MVDHLRSREAFGAPLADAQALRFRLADMGTELAAARTLLRHAAEALDARSRDLRVYEILEGTNEIMRVIVSRSMLEAVR